MTKCKGAQINPAPSNTRAQGVIATTQPSSFAGKQVSTTHNKNIIAHHNIPTPVKAENLKLYLEGYDPVLSKMLVDGFSKGFHLSFEGPQLPLSSRNSVSALTNKKVVDEKIKAELHAGRISGPYTMPPLKNFKCSPLSLREKSVPNTFRLLHNLSYPYDHRAVNFNIKRENSSVQYETLLAAIDIIQNSTPTPYLSKSDVAEAFRIIPLHPSQYNLTGFEWEGLYYYDKVLPQGCASSCKIFEAVSTALKWILTNLFNVNNICKILEDFLFIGRYIY